MELEEVLGISTNLGTEKWWYISCHNKWSMNKADSHYVRRLLYHI